jgi:hypothetical protein
METNNTKQNNDKTIHENRRKLISLSEAARLVQEAEAPDMSINEILIQEFYSNDEHQEFNTFWEWKKQGYSVMKGEKAFLVWGRKKKANDKEQGEEPKPEDKSNYSFFPLCYLFSNAQVEPLKTNKDA